MERLEDLNLNGLKIYQDDALYKFTSDAVLLTRFATVKKGDVVADFCSGSGIVGLHLYALHPDKVNSVTMFEMQTPLFELSKKSVAVNGLQDKFIAVNCRVQDIPAEYTGKFSLVVCNPPYMPVGHGFYEESDTIAVCRTELTLPLNELIKAISKALKFGGRTAIVHRADRLSDIIFEMRNNNIEPKRLQFVSGGDKEPYLLMIEGVKGGKSGIKILNTIKN
ncbi:MAG: methyltransferase [Clostridia bacterium]|nr:methyltransferase [Clostridia bacterium]